MIIMAITIHFFGSSLCPRCRLVKRYLDDYTRNNSEVTIKEHEVLRQPIRHWHAGIRMIPRVQIGSSYLSGLFLTRKQINAFLHLNITANYH